MYLIFNSPDERDLFYKQIVQQPGKVLSHGEISLIPVTAVIKFFGRLCTDLFPTYTYIHVNQSYLYRSFHKIEVRK